jgi:hypothetical protein
VASSSSSSSSSRPLSSSNAHADMVHHQHQLLRPINNVMRPSSTQLISRLCQCSPPSIWRKTLELLFRQPNLQPANKLPL